MPSSVSSGYLCSISTISENSKLQFSPHIKCHKLWCQTRVLLLSVPLEGKISASKLICSFSSHAAAFGFWASLPPDNITLNPANKKTDQNLSDFQTGTDAAAHATLDIEQVISHTRAALVDTNFFPQGCD